MDTTKWGPSGWFLLHSIAANYPNKPSKVDKEVYRLFFTSIKYVLPCIYCRNSFTQYLGELPIEPYLENKKTLTRWLYDIHNKVNAKLRGQGLNDKPDPSFKEIYNRYNKIVKDIDNNCMEFPGWVFYYSIALNFPKKHFELETDRYLNHIIFFNYLIKVFPFKHIKVILEDYIRKNPIQRNITTRSKLTHWLYKMEKTVSETIDCECPKYRDRCNYVEQFRAGCGTKKDIKPTCRLNNTRK